MLRAPAVPDLIGLRDRRYLDKTGLGRHRGIADLMRYAAMNQLLDVNGNYGGFVPKSSDMRTRAAAREGLFQPVRTIATRTRNCMRWDSSSTR